MLTSEQAMADLFLQHKRCRNQSEAVGKQHGPIATEQTEACPDGHPAGEQAVHRQRNGARVVCAQGLDGLREEAQGGQSRGQVTN